MIHFGLLFVECGYDFKYREWKCWPKNISGVPFENDNLDNQNLQLKMVMMLIWIIDLIKKMLKMVFHFVPFWIFDVID